MTEPKSDKLQITYRKVGGLIPYVRNSRTHSDSQIDQIVASIRKFGWTNPILLDGENGIIAGHGRVLAAKRLGMDEIPCIELSNVTEQEKRAYVIADNKLALNADWDELTLLQELDFLAQQHVGLEITGFSNDEVEELRRKATPLLKELREELKPIAWTRMLISVPVGQAIPGTDEYVRAVLAAGGRVDYAGN